MVSVPLAVAGRLLQNLARTMPRLLCAYVIFPRITLVLCLPLCNAMCCSCLGTHRHTSCPSRIQFRPKHEHSPSKQHQLLPLFSQSSLAASPMPLHGLPSVGSCLRSPVPSRLHRLQDGTKSSVIAFLLSSFITCYRNHKYPCSLRQVHNDYLAL